MSDAALAVAQIAAPPRPQQSSSADSSGEASSDSGFDAMVQSSVNAQNADAAESATQKRSNDTANAQGTDSSSDTSDKVAVNDNEVSPKQPGKPATNAKSEKTDKKQSGKNAGDAAPDASALGAAQVQLQAQAQAQTQVQPNATPSAASAPKADKPTQDNASEKAATPCNATPLSGTTPPVTSPGSALPAQAAQPDGSAAGVTQTTNDIAVPTGPAAATATAIPGVPSPVLAAKTDGQQANAQPAIKGPGSANATLNDSTKGNSSEAAAAQTAVAAQAKGGTKIQAGNTSPDAQKASIVTEQTAPAIASAEEANAAAPTKPDSKDAPKKGAPKDTMATSNANSLATALAAAGAPDSKPVDPIGANAPSKTDGQASPTRIDTTAPTSAKTADTNAPAINSPAVTAPKADASLGAFEVKAKEAVAQQGANTSSPAARVADTQATTDAKPSGQAAAQNASAQPAVPPSAQPQNPTLIVANIVQTASPNANSAPTIHAQMDGPRLTLPADQIAVEIRRHQTAGADHFNIKIDPPELGRIDVKIEMTSDGQTKAHLTADRQETLDLLQRDSGALQRALNSNGLRTDKDSLNFSLRQDNPSSRDGSGANNGSQGRGANPNNYYGEDEIVEMAPVRARFIDPTRIDILI
ncbi:MAG: flagellar hook-length control protein FliK [Alphaproteobacteria bacterium]